MLAGVYAIRNVIDNKRYIGSTVNLKKRRGNHFSFLRNGRHGNKHIQSAFNKYGEDNFVFEVLEHVHFPGWEYLDGKLKSAYMIVKEKAWIDCLDTSNHSSGYNMMKDPRLLYKPKTSEETRRRISEANKGKIRSKETRRRISESKTGMEFTKDHRFRLSEAKIGRNLSDETRRRISEANKGKTRSEETRRRIRQCQKGKVVTEDQRHRMSEAHKGVALSEEHRRRISEALKGKKREPHTEETRRRISEAKKGKKTKPPSEETRRRISEALKGRKRLTTTT